MQFASFVSRKDCDLFEFEDQPENVQWMARTYGCSCCSELVVVTPENIKAEIESTERRLEFLRTILAEVKSR